MTTFDDRERSFEKKFALDQELRFKAQARRNKLLGAWAAAKLGLSGPEADEYIKAVRKADLLAKGDADVSQRVLQDFEARGVALTPAELRKTMDGFLAQAVAQIEAEGSAH